MNVFLAGATGAIGRPSIDILVARGHRVFAMTRNAARSEELWQAGAIPVIVDAMEAEPLRLALRATRPDVVIDQLTDLAGLREPGRLEETLARNAELRKRGTPLLVAAALSAGVGHIVAQSIVWFYAPGPEPHDDDAPLDLQATGTLGVSVGGVAALEHAVLDTPGLRGCVLRYGQLYGPRTGNAAATGMDIPLHVEAAAWAAVLAAEQGAAGTFNVAEANGHVSTDKATRELGWHDALRL